MALLLVTAEKNSRSESIWEKGKCSPMQIGQITSDSILWNGVHFKCLELLQITYRTNNTLSIRGL